MTTDLVVREAPATWPDALAPVRAVLLAEARRAAADVHARAAAEADAVIEEARRRAGAILAETAERGTAEGAAVAALAKARARRHARETVLAAQREAYEELRRRSHDAVQALRDGPGYLAIHHGLSRYAEAQVGPDATVTEHPGGGVIAEGPSRRLDLSVDTLADRALDTLGVEVEELWTR